MSSIAEKSLVEINHSKELLKSRFIRRWREISKGRGMLGKRMEAGTGDENIINVNETVKQIT